MKIFGFHLVVFAFMLVSTANAWATTTCSRNSECADGQTCAVVDPQVPSYKKCTCDDSGDCDIGERCGPSPYCERIQCGDDILDTGELCDDGAGNSDNRPDACRTDCRLPYCDDGVIDSGEQCDDGSANADFQPNRCREDCSLPVCGDEIVDDAYGEECDEGAGNSDAQGATCSTQCIIPGCGNGTLETWEMCDDNNTSDADACTGQCRYNVCGDGFVWTSVEQCEYDSPWDRGTCRYDCGQNIAACGNGTVDAGEGCDDGADRNSDEPDNPCRTDCQPQRCGDGVVDAGEACDREEGCAPDCTWLGPR